MAGKRIEDLAGVEVEHLLGLATGLPLVKLRAESTGTVLVGQLAPAQARQIASHLFDAAARAEYEHDLATATRRAGFGDDLLTPMLHLVREGERHRHESGA